MRHGSSALRLIALLLGIVATAAAQQGPKPQVIPDAPAAKQERAPQKQENSFNTTIEILRAWEVTESVSAHPWQRQGRVIFSVRFFFRPCCTVIRATSQPCTEAQDIASVTR
jgi:hypothetical protein